MDDFRSQDFAPLGVDTSTWKSQIDVDLVTDPYLEQAWKEAMVKAAASGQPTPLNTKKKTYFVSSDMISAYNIKEDWFFDKQRSVLDVRIIGMCPVQEVFDGQTGDYKGEKPLFWIYFPEARHIFANEVVFNRYSDSEKRTLEDIFWKRSFSSYIYKTSNVYDRQLNEYKSNLDLLLESKNIKEVVFNMEQDFWEY